MTNLSGPRYDDIMTNNENNQQFVDLVRKEVGGTVYHLLNLEGELITSVVSDIDFAKIATPDNLIMGERYGEKGILLTQYVTTYEKLWIYILDNERINYRLDATEVLPKITRFYKGCRSQVDLVRELLDGDIADLESEVERVRDLRDWLTNDNDVVIQGE